MSQVAARLGITSLPCPVVTIAGTNGKGSTVAMLDAVLRAADRHTGCYTSPHFLKYNERVTLDGDMVSDDLLTRAFYQIEQARKEISLSYFEFGTLAALLIFQQHKPDVVLLEVGLGGRLDAVNLIDPDIAVVTTVALDHESWLGSDLAQIGREKAGIFRKDRPAIMGSAQLVESVRETALTVGAVPVRQLGAEFRWLPSGNGDSSWVWQSLDDRGQVLEQLSDLPPLNLPQDNAATVIQVVRLLCPDLSENVIRRGLASACLTGRLQRIGRFLLDVAHNPHAAAYIASKLPAVRGRRVALLGMLDDKDVEAVLEIMAPYFDAWYLAELNSPRATPTRRIKYHLEKLGCANIYSAGSVAEALQQVLKHTQADDDILVFGSFLTVAGVLEHQHELTPV